MRLYHKSASITAHGTVLYIAAPHPTLKTCWLFFLTQQNIKYYNWHWPVQEHQYVTTNDDKSLTDISDGF